MILFFQVNKNFKDFSIFVIFLFSIPHKKELVAGRLLCQINTSGCRLTLEREWRSQPWPPREGMGAPTGWAATSWCSATAGGAGSSIAERRASRYVRLLKSSLSEYELCQLQHFAAHVSGQVQKQSLLNYSKIFPRNVRHIWHFRIHCLCIIYETSKR